MSVLLNERANPTGGQTAKGCVPFRIRPQRVASPLESRDATAGGLTSGIDMALHIVSRYYGTEIATAAAAYMEYTSDAWRV
jgi:hypothetical protein